VAPDTGFEPVTK